MRICLFEDGGVSRLEPLSLTRPVFDLVSGTGSLGTRQLRYYGVQDVGLLVRPELLDMARLTHARVPINDPGWLCAGPTLLVNGRWLPPARAQGDRWTVTPCVGLVGDEVAYAMVEAGQLAWFGPDTVSASLDAWKRALPTRPAGGALVGSLWDLVNANSELLSRDALEAPLPAPTCYRPASFALVGPSDRLTIAQSARIDPLVLADTTSGPVIIDRDAVVTAFSRLEGPCYVGPGSHVLGARIRGGTTIGPMCRVGGEVEASLLQGFSNKYHDGFLGHSVVGEWVNLGAGTQTSDLRNDYGEITVTVAGQRVATRQTKVGSFLGDHVKAGIGTLLNSGTNVGPFGHLLPSGGLLPRWVPAFCRASAEGLWEESLERLLTTAATVMGRRQQTLTAAHRELYRRVFTQSTAERRLALRESEQRRLRRSA